MSLGRQGVLVQLSAVAIGAGGKPSFYSWSDPSPTDHPLNLMMMMIMKMMMMDTMMIMKRIMGMK